jgi:hypothetical protein
MHFLVFKIILMHLHVYAFTEACRYFAVLCKPEQFLRIPHFACCFNLQLHRYARSPNAQWHKGVFDNTLQKAALTAADLDTKLECRGSKRKGLFRW